LKSLVSRRDTFRDEERTPSDSLRKRYAIIAEDVARQSRIVWWRYKVLTRSRGNPMSIGGLVHWKWVNISRWCEVVMTMMHPICGN
jgi:hypothetical protein